MTLRARALARRLRRSITPLLLAIAVVSFGFELAHLRSAHTERGTRLAIVQSLGSAATRWNGARLERADESLLFDARGRGGNAAWRFAAFRFRLARGTTVENASAFITEGAVRFAGDDGYADITLDGQRLAHLVARALPSTPDSDAPAYAVDNADAVPLDIPPAVRIGYRFALPSGAACIARDCTLEVSLHDAQWKVRSVALLFETRTAAGPALWTQPANVLAIVTAVLGIALLSTLGLAFAYRVRPAIAATKR